jgi:hypothetical protein
MTDEEIAEMKRLNAELLQEKAEAQRQWHEEVRATLATHSAQLATINANITAAVALQPVVAAMEKRIKVVEEFKVRLTAYVMGAFGVVAVFWKLVDKLWK